MQKNDITNKSILKAGSYYVGDLSMVITEKKWNKFVNAMYTHKDFNTGLCSLNETKFWWHITHKGDGTYEDNNGELYGTVSGILGILPHELVNGKELQKNHVHGNVPGSIEDFHKDFEVWYDDGIFHFEELTIDTQ